MSDKKLNLDKSGLAQLLKKQIAEDIDLYCETAYDDGHRSHLGASLIGNECSRYLWYVFRWVYHHKFDGRMQRLFNRGHREEERFIEWLEGIGFKVWADDLENNTLWYNSTTDTYKVIAVGEDFTDEWLEAEDVTKSKVHIKRAKADGVKFPQYRISGANGHFGGSMDGIAEFPESYGIEGKILLEFKTNGTGAGFNKLLEQGMQMSKEMHYAQTSVYGFKADFDWVLYLNICKNDDNLHVELVPLNKELGEQLEIKAEKIIMSQEPPPKLSESPTYFKCKWCDMIEVCHKDKMAEKNCRSCVNAIPVENGEWKCNKFDGVIPKDFIKQGCNNWESII